MKYNIGNSFMTLKELRELDLSKGCPKVKGLPDVIDPTKYYPFIESKLNKKWVSVESLLEYINESRNNGNMIGGGFSAALLVSDLVKELEEQVK